MAADHSVFHSPRQFNHAPRKHQPSPSHRTVGGDRHGANTSRYPPRPSRHAAGPPPPPHPIRVTPIQSRSPSPERVAILGPPVPIAQAQEAQPMAPEAHVPPMENLGDDHDIAARLRVDRQAFYVKAATAARESVTMDRPKPPLRPPMQPPGLFYLLQCGLLKFDLDNGEFQDFEEEVHNWKNSPSFMDRLDAAYGRFHYPSHQVQPFFFPIHLCLFLPCKCFNRCCNMCLYGQCGLH